MDKISFIVRYETSDGTATFLATFQVEAVDVSSAIQKYVESGPAYKPLERFVSVTRAECYCGRQAIPCPSCSYADLYE